MATEVVIQRSVDYARARDWDREKQDELAARTIRTIRPDWSDIQALSAVDWVRSLSLDVVPESHGCRVSSGQAECRFSLLLWV